MVRVLHINSNYLTSKLHENLLDCLAEQNIQNTVFMPIKKETAGHFLYESKHEVYSPVTFLDIDKFIFTYKQIKIYRKLKSTIDPQDYSVVHAHTLFTDGNIAYQLNKEYGIPYVVTVRGYTDINGFFRLRVNLRNRGRKILAKASKVIFLSEMNKNELLDKYISDEELKQNIIEKAEVIPNGIDDFYFENEGQARQLEAKEKLAFLQVGKIMPLKNGLGSIRGIQKYQALENKEAELTLVGEVMDNEYAQKLKEKGKGLVTHHDAVSMAELIDMYRDHDIFIMPSFSETFGLVYPEAMSQGLPVIYTKGQGFDGQFEDGYVGYPVIADDAEDIAKKIALIIENYEEISGNVLKAYQKFNWNILSEKYRSIYLKLAEDVKK